MIRITTFICCCTILLALCTANAQTEVNSGPTSLEATNLSTPENTWSMFRNALLEGNYDLAMEYCCPDKKKAVTRYKKLGKVKTRRIFRYITSIEKVYQDDNAAQYKINRDIKGKKLTTYMSFAKIDNQWKIDKY